MLKRKANNIWICQSCRKDYNGSNDTLELVVLRAERRLVSNLATGVQFLGKESNSHYHAHRVCLVKARARSKVIRKNCARRERAWERG